MFFLKHGSAISTIILLALILLVFATRLPADDWPQWRGPNRDGTWNETGIIDRFEDDQLEIRWQAPIGAGYCGPTVADGRVFVMDRLLEPEPVERVLCFDAKSGIEIWSHSYDCPYIGIGYPAGPRASVSIEDGRAYSLGAMGHLHCLDAGTGAILWSRDLYDQYKIRMPGWGIAASPLVVGDLVIVQIGGADGACIVAFHKKDGDEVWRSLDDRPSYSAPILITQAGTPVIVCWTGDNIVGLDPKDGTAFWKHAFPPARMVIAVATPVVRRNRLFVTSFYDGSAMLRLDTTQLAVEPVWQRRGFDEQLTDALHSTISTPLLMDDCVYGVDSYGELRCLDGATGDRIWEDRSATPRGRWSTVHLVKNGDRIWMFNERGELILSRLSPNGFRELSRAKLIAPTTRQLNKRGGVCWAHPAFADRHVVARNDKEIVCASLEAD